MPISVLTYVSGLLSVSESATCTAIARVVGRSHDRLSRTFKDTKFEWQTLLRAFIFRAFGNLSGGHLIIDDVVLNKGYARCIENLSWVYCSKEQRSVLGLNLVVLCWSNDTITIPLAVKIWKKGSKKSKYDLALELLSYARNILILEPEYVTFDSWYAAQKILNWSSNTRARTLSPTICQHPSQKSWQSTKPDGQSKARTDFPPSTRNRAFIYAEFGGCVSPVI